jgi:[protein-PII] uridylyltransferase
LAARLDRALAGGDATRDAPAALAALKQFVADERGRIVGLHRAGSGGLQVVRELSDLVDTVVTHLHRRAHLAAPEGARAETDGVALLALGGYGRRELNPGSDVDLMFLFPRRVDAYLQTILDHVLYSLWDLGLPVGHSTRTLADCVALGRADTLSLTAMLEGRFLGGHRSIAEALQQRLAKLVSGRRAARFMAAKRAEWERRIQKYGASLYVQEPNVKESAGGLRDLHAALWMARARHRVGDLEGLRRAGVLSRGEWEESRAALDYLLRLRTELHLQAGSKQDVLSLPLQQATACGLGYTDGGGRHAVEPLMREYYLHARSLRLIAERIAERCAEGRSQVEVVMRKLAAREIGDGFTEVRHQLHAKGDAPEVFREDPVRLLKIFWTAQQTGYELSPEAKELVCGHLHLIDDPFRRSSRALASFLAILREPHGVARTLRTMHELGVLTAYIPEFERVTCQVQFDYYHKYTVDEHTFIALDGLEALHGGGGGRQDEFRSIARELKRPDLFRLAVLLHDIGKGEGSGHVERGVALSRQILGRMGLPEEDTETVVFLVAHHLTMAHIAERRDLDDEPMVIEFAQRVQAVDLLKLLYLLTYLDIRAVGPDVWTDWKGSLLWELFLRTHAILTRGVPESAEELRKAAALRAQVVAELAPEFGAPAVERHLDLMPPRYLLTTSKARLATHLRLVAALDGGAEVTSQWAAYPSASFAELVVCGYGRPGRFAQVVGCLTANGANILSAQAFTRRDGLVIRNFQVDDGRGSAITDEAVWRRVQGDLEQVARGEVPVRELIRNRRREVLLRPVRRGRAMPTRVEFDNFVSDTHTVIDVRTQDRPGLLYLIASTLSSLGLDLSLAKIATEADQVMDVFYITEADGQKVQAEDRMAEIRGALERAIGEGLV